jgi:hypothetical protein
MAWARTRRVRPPVFALAQARAAGINLAWLDGSSNGVKAKANCCVAQTSTDKACCAREPTASVAKTEERPCCSERHLLASVDDSNRADDVHRLIGVRALACRGQALDWLAAVPTLIMPPCEHLIDLPLVEYLAPAASDVAGGISAAPDVPPPERA